MWSRKTGNAYVKTHVLSICFCIRACLITNAFMRMPESVWGREERDREREWKCARTWAARVHARVHVGFGGWVRLKAVGYLLKPLVVVLSEGNMYAGCVGQDSMGVGLSSGEEPAHHYNSGAMGDALAHLAGPHCYSVERHLCPCGYSFPSDSRPQHF